MTDIYFDKLIKDDEKLFLKSTELLYFAYRDYIAWPDVVLKKYNFGRAHHRIIFFVNQNPGITVAELLTLLNITKQSLSRVLSTLLSKSYISQNIGTNDRRKRLLNLTSKGKKLLSEVSEYQNKQMVKACKEAGPIATDGFWKVLTNLIDEKNKKGSINLTYK